MQLDISDADSMTITKVYKRPCGHLEAFVMIGHDGIYCSDCDGKFELISESMTLDPPPHNR
jgi:hypothetical protein